MQIAFDRTLYLNDLRADAGFNFSFLADSHALRVINGAFNRPLNQQVLVRGQFAFETQRRREDRRASGERRRSSETRGVSGFEAPPGRM